MVNDPICPRLLRTGHAPEIFVTICYKVGRFDGQRTRGKARLQKGKSLCYAALRGQPP